MSSLNGECVGTDCYWLRILARISTLKQSDRKLIEKSYHETYSAHGYYSPDAVFVKSHYLNKLLKQI